MTLIGTSHFISRVKAYDYYEPLGYTPQDVIQKIREGEIQIGNIPKDWTGHWNSEGRFIREEK